MKERSLDALEQGRHLDEIDGRLSRQPGHARLGGAGRHNRCQLAEIRMRAANALCADSPNLADRCVAGKAENVKEVVHREPDLAGLGVLPRAKRQTQFALGAVIERIEIERAVTFVTEQLDQGRPALFLRRLQLRVGNPQ